MLEMIDVQRECVKCGYDLLGLPDTGKCPECGQKFNVLTGEGLRGTAGATSEAQKRADHILGRIRTISLAVVAVGLFGMCLSIEILRQQFDWTDRSAASSPLLWTGGLVSLIIGMAAISSWMKEKEDQ